MDYIFGFCEDESGPKTKTEFIHSTNDASKELFKHPETVISGEEIDKLVREYILKKLDSKK